MQKRDLTQATLPRVDSKIWQLDENLTSGYSIRDPEGWSKLVVHALETQDRLQTLDVHARETEKRLDTFTGIAVLLALALAVVFAALLALGVLHFTLRSRVRAGETRPTAV